jgi:dihydrofolate reductase
VALPILQHQMGDAVGAAMDASDAMLMGRVLYEEWAEFWPKQDPDGNPVTARMNGVKKYVVSTTLEEPLEWQNSTLIGGEKIAEEISPGSRSSRARTSRYPAVLPWSVAA